MDEPVKKPKSGSFRRRSRHATLVTRDRRDGRLNCARWIDPRLRVRKHSVFSVAFRASIMSGPNTMKSQACGFRVERLRPRLS